ncbi:hypothetical protein ACHAXS_003282 [Conticribra weissflogii]
MVRSAATVAAYSTDSETLFDTISEPPRCHGKLAEKLKNRGNGTGSGRDPDGESNCYEPRTPVEPPEDDAKTKSKTKKSTSVHSKASKTSTSTSTSKVSTSTSFKASASASAMGGSRSLKSSGGNGNATLASVNGAASTKKKSFTSQTTADTKKSKKPTSSSPSSSASVVSTGSSRSRKATYWDGTSSSTSSGRVSRKPKSCSSTTNARSSNPPFARTPSRDTTRTNASSRISGASKVSNYVLSSACGGNATVSASGDGNSAANVGLGEFQRTDDVPPAGRQLALVPISSGRPAVDPPPANHNNNHNNNASSSSTTASCTSSEDSHGNGGESGMAMVQYYGDPPSVNEGRLEVWNGGGDGKRRGNDPQQQQQQQQQQEEEEEESILEGSDDEESRSRLDTILSGSEYSSDEDERTYEDEDIEEQDYRDDDDDDDDDEDGIYNEDSDRSGSGSGSNSEAAAGRELVVAEQSLSRRSSASRRRSSNNSPNPEHNSQNGQLVVADPKNDSDAQALAPYEHPSNQAIVPSQPRYLASAVDNNFAMVPLTSDIFEAYDHTFVTCPEHLRFRFLYTFLKKNLDKKILIFFSTTHSAKFHGKLLGHFHVPCLTMHGRMKKDQFIKTFFRFSDMEEGILCATDAAGRDLDIPPSVDWVIQFEPPDDPSEYILRVARISCDSDRVGRSLLFLNPGEMGFLKYYHSAAIPVSEFEIPKLADIQANIEYHVNESESLKKYAKDAYGSYLIAYASHGFRDVYNVHDLNKNDVAAAFGLVRDLEDEEEDEAEGSGSDRDRDRDGYRGGGSVSRNNNHRGSNGMWQSQKKKKEKTWLKTEKTWPHCQVKLHPSFKPGYKKPPPEADEGE